MALKIRLIVFFIFFCAAFSFSQKSTDSLINALPLMKEDTAKAQALIKIAKSYLGGDHSERALPYILRSLEICKKLDYDRGTAGCYGHLGGYYYSHSDFKNTIKYWLLAIKCAQ